MPIGVRYSQDRPPITLFPAASQPGHPALTLASSRLGGNNPKCPPEAPRDVRHVPQPPRPFRLPPQRAFEGTSLRRSAGYVALGRTEKAGNDVTPKKTQGGRRAADWRGVQKPKRAAGAPGGERPPESGPRPFLRRRPPGKQRVNDRVRSLTDLRPLRGGEFDPGPHCTPWGGDVAPSSRRHGQGPTDTGRD